MDVKIIIALVTVVASAVLGAEARYTPQATHYRHVAESLGGFVLQLVDQARAEPVGSYKDSLCRTLEEAIGEICAMAPSHSICTDRMIHRQRAGC